jgi:hypothetical protein
MRYEINDHENFEQYLYTQMCLAFPETTVRSFSAALGKSAGYWSSVCAQGLKVSNAALLHLIDYLECTKIRMDASSARRQAIEKIQKQITAELLARLDLHDEFFSQSRNSAQHSHQGLDSFLEQPLPFVISITNFHPSKN